MGEAVGVRAGTSAAIRLRMRGLGAAGRAWGARAAHHPLTWVTLAAVAIRVVVLAGVSVSLGYNDSIRYTRQAAGVATDADEFSPPGYALFLRIVHSVTSSVDAVLVAQQLLVVIAGLCVYKTARLMGTRVGVATGAAAVMMLCGNLIATSQALLTESLAATLLAAAGLLVVLQIQRPSTSTALALGAVLGAAITVRSVVLVAAVVFLAMTMHRTRSGALAALGIVGSATAVIAIVAAVMSTTAGIPLVGSSSNGFLLYGRVATFVDCDAIHPPRDLQFLCIAEPPSARPGPNYYRFVGGPAVERFNLPEEGDSELASFARRAIRAQPLDYAKAVAIDTTRFFKPRFGADRPYAGAGWDEIELDRDPGEGALAVRRQIERWYAPWSTRASTLTVAARYQELTSLHGGQLLVLLLLAVLAAAWGTPHRRAGWALLLGVLALLVTAAAVNMSVARYAVPTFGLLLPAAACGLTALAYRIAAPAASRAATRSPG